MKEAMRYMENAKEILKQSPIEDRRYKDDKYVKSACGIAYLAILKSIDSYLIKKGLTRKEMPKSVDAYRKALQEHLKPYNGKLLRQFEDIYDELHIAGYYRGNLHTVDAVKAALKTAEDFIKKVSPK